MSFLMKSFNFLYFMARCVIILKMHFFITKRFFYQCDEKSYQNFNVDLLRLIDYHFPWLFTLNAPPYHKLKSIFACLFQATIFMCFIEIAQKKVPASLLWPMQIHDLLLDITFFQSSTLHDCFFVANCNFPPFKF